MKNKRKIIYNRNEPYIWNRHERLYLKDFDQNGYHDLYWCNVGYMLSFRIIGFEYGIDDYAIIEEV